MGRFSVAWERAQSSSALSVASASLIGYSLRAITGFFASKTQVLAFAFIGYAINMLAVPALALAGNWPTAALS